MKKNRMRSRDELFIMIFSLVAVLFGLAVFITDSVSGKLNLLAAMGISAFIGLSNLINHWLRALLEKYDS